MDNILELLNQYFGVAIGIVFIFDLALLFLILKIKKNTKTIFNGTSSGDLNLEKVLLELRQNEAAFGSALKEIVKRVGDIESELPKDLRRVGLVRFNPFSGTGAGGDQSFALAILNESNDGIIITSLYGREMNRVYAKLIKGGKSSYQLSGEEAQAIAEAK